MATLGARKRHKVTVVGSGNWGSTIAKVVAENTIERPDLFEPTVTMWVYEEDVKITEGSKHYKAEAADETRKLSEVVNELHENIKYLPDIRLPDNIVANPSLVESVKDATILIFNMPHQFIPNITKQIRGKIVPHARAISCIKGIDVNESGIRLFSEVIGEELNIYCGALSGANIATEVALEKWCETTVAYDPPPLDSRQPSPEGTPRHSPKSSTVDLRMTAADGTVRALNGGGSARSRHSAKLLALPSDYPPLSHENLKVLFHRPAYFHVRMVDDVVAVSLGGALKNIVALAAGFVAGLGWGENAKSAVIRIGLLEEVKFGKMFFADKGVVAETFTEESCGVADIITSCMGGRNYKCAKSATEQGLTVDEVEEKELNGQKLQGTGTAVEVRRFLESQGRVKDFPLFGAVYEILQGNAKPKDIPSLVEPRT